MLDAGPNSDTFFLIIEKIWFLSKVILKMGDKFLDGNLFVGKKISDKLKSSVEDTRIPNPWLGRILRNKYTCSVVMFSLHSLWNYFFDLLFKILMWLLLQLLWMFCYYALKCGNLNQQIEIFKSLKLSSVWHYQTPKKDWKKDLSPSSFISLIL